MTVTKLVKQKPTPTYIYQQDENKDGEMKERVISKKDLENNNYDPEKITFSKIKPSQRKLNRQAYEAGYIGLGEKTQGNYSQTIEWGKEGGTKSSRRKWKNEAEKQRAKRARKKLGQGQELNSREKKLITKDFGLSNLQPLTRPGAYKYHRDRPATANERKKRFRQQKKLDLIALLNN